MRFSTIQISTLLPYYYLYNYNSTHTLPYLPLHTTSTLPLPLPPPSPTNTNPTATVIHSLLLLPKTHKYLKLTQRMAVPRTTPRCPPPYRILIVLTY